MLIFVFSPYSDSRILLDAAISSLISCILSAIQSLLRISWSDSPLSILYGQYMILIYFIYRHFSHTFHIWSTCISIFFVLAASSVYLLIY